MLGLAVQTPPRGVTVSVAGRTVNATHLFENGARDRAGRTGRDLGGLEDRRQDRMSRDRRESVGDLHRDRLHVPHIEFEDSPPGGISSW